MNNKKQVAELFNTIMNVQKGSFFNASIEDQYKLERILIKVAEIKLNFKNELEKMKFIKTMLNIKQKGYKMNNNKEINTYLPVFTGFYEGIYEPDETSEIDYINELRNEKNLKNIDYDNCEFDYDNYYLDISSQLCDILEDELSKFVYKIEFKKIESPKFYNYSNDKIDCIIKPKKQAILNYIKKHKTEFKKYLKDNYTSYDGFISFYDNNLDSKDWNNHNIINGEHQLGSVLNFICINEGINELDLYDSLQDIYLSCTNFNELTKQKGYKMNYNKIVPFIILILFWSLFIYHGLNGYYITPFIPLLITSYLFYKVA